MIKRIFPPLLGAVLFLGVISAYSEQDEHDIILPDEFAWTEELVPDDITDELEQESESPDTELEMPAPDESGTPVVSEDPEVSEEPADEELYNISGPVTVLQEPEADDDIDTSENMADAEKELEDVHEHETSGSKKSRAAASEYKVAKAETNGSFSFINTSYNSFNDAKREMESRAAAATTTLDKNSYVVCYGGVVVAMTSGIAAVTKSGTLSYARKDGSETGYIVSKTVLHYYGTNSLSSVEVGVSGSRFATSYENLILIPTPFTKSYGTGSFQNRYEMGYYSNDGGELIHMVTTLTDPSIGTHYESGEKTVAAKVVIDKAPAFMKNGVKYYSMDGINFFVDEALTSKAGTYYPYYQYLPYHTKSGYTAAQLNEFLNYYAGSKHSVMKNSGSAFIDAQNQCGINALLEFAFACHESAYGTSTIATSKLNLFGIKAYDENEDAASTFSSVREGVLYHAKAYLKEAYLNAVSDWRYYGANPGSKHGGVNVKYASDPYHGEKLAGWAYRIDKYFGFKDYQAYSIGVTNKVGTVYNGNNLNTSLYTLTNSGTSLSGVPVASLNSGNGYYQVQSDVAIESGKAKPTAAYSYNHVGYTKSSDIVIIREGKRAQWELINGKWYYKKADGTYAVGWVKVNNIWYYMNSSGVMLTGWQKISSKWYYMNGSGAMLTGWQRIGNVWYYMNSSGAMLTGWQKISNKWYYMNSSGAMLTGWQRIGNVWYYMNSSGAMVTGWLKLGSTWYYMNSSGAMLANTSQVINGKRYYFNASGRCTNP